MDSISLICRLILSKKSATFWDRGSGQAARGLAKQIEKQIDWSAISRRVEISVRANSGEMTLPHLEERRAKSGFRAPLCIINLVAPFQLLLARRAYRVSRLTRQIRKTGPRHGWLH